MAEYKNLPIYKKAFELLVFVENAVKSFSRYHKYTIGSELRVDAQKLVVDISTLNAVSVQNKVGFLMRFSADLEKYKIKMNVCRELQVFKSYNSWYHAAELLHDIGRQSDGLRKHFEKKSLNQRSES